MSWDYSIVTHLASQKFYRKFGIKEITISPIEYIYRDYFDGVAYHNTGKGMIGFVCDIESGDIRDNTYTDRTYHVYLEEYYQEVRDRKLNQIGI